MIQMILTFFLLFTTALTIFPCSLTCLSPAPVKQQQAEMSELNLEIMRQLLAEQARSLLSELRNQVKIEVTNQLEVHTTKLVQLEEEQELLRKHLNDISTQLAFLVPVPPAGPTNVPPVSVVSPTPTTAQIPTPTSTTMPATIDQHNLKVIESAKRTLIFSPIPHADLIRTKGNVNDKATPEVALEEAFREFIAVNVDIPTHVNLKMATSSILYQQEIDPDKISVEFSDIESVKTIFRYVKNLSPGQKVSNFIPTVLNDKYMCLQSQAYQIRNGNIRHKTVIKYHGNTLALYAKPMNIGSWQLVSDKPH